MPLSKVTMLFAARGLGDLLHESGIAPEALRHAVKDEEFRSAAREELMFKMGSTVVPETSDYDQGATEASLLVLAVRHAVGRMTAGAHQVADEVEARWDSLDELYRQQIADIIEGKLASDNLGMSVDAERWLRIRDKVASLTPSL